MQKQNSFATELAEVHGDIESQIPEILNAVSKRPTAPRAESAADKSVAQAHLVVAEESGGVQSKVEEESKGSISQKRKTRVANIQLEEQNVVLQNVTTRLSPGTNDSLTEAALKQKLKRIKPDSRQGIIEVAVVEWLKKHGYNTK